MQTMDQQAGLPSRDMNESAAIPSYCQECGEVIDNLITVRDLGRDKECCAPCAASLLGCVAMQALDVYWPTADYRTLKITLAAWEEIGKRLRAKVEAEGQKPACQMVQLHCDGRSGTPAVENRG